MDDFRRLVAGQDKFAKLVEDDAMGPAYALSKQLQAVNVELPRFRGRLRT
jgi:hypothetical protein